MSSRHNRFFPPDAQTTEAISSGHPQVGPDLGDRVPEGFPHLLFGQADHLHLGTPATYRRTTFGLGERPAGPSLLVAAPSMATSAKPAGTPRSRAPGLRSVATVKHVTVEVVSVLLT